MLLKFDRSIIFAYFPTKIMKMKIPNLKLLFLLFIVASTVYAQKPSVVPNPTEEPVDFSKPANIIIFIILPICAIILYLIWRKKRKKEEQ